MQFFWKKPGSGFTKAFTSMITLAWRAGPLCFGVLVVLELGQGVIPLASAWLTKTLFDRLSVYLTDSRTTVLPPDVFMLLAGLAGLSAVGSIVPHIHGYFNATLGRRVTFNVQSIVYHKICNFVGLRYFEDSQFHDTIQLATHGAQSGPIQALSTFMTTVRSSVTLVAFTGVLLVLNPLLVVIVAVAVIPQLYVQLNVGHQRFNLAVANSAKERRVTYYGYLLSGLHAAKELRLFNLGPHFLSLFQRTQQDIHQATQRQHAHEVRSQTLLSVLVSVVSAGAFVVVIYKAVAGRLSLGDITLYTSAVSSVQAALVSLVAAFATLNEGVLFFNRFTQLMALPQPVHVSESKLPVPPLECIELRGVSFRYSDQHPWVLRDLNLVIPGGSCVALVGLNGAGKTTLVKLLTRLYDPSEGAILWNGINISAFEPDELRDRMSAIFQDFTRYEVSVHDNIAVGAVTQIDQKAHVQQAAMQAGIHEIIEQLPHGYQTILSHWLAEGHPGIELSGGQWQRMAIARMFMRDADFLILDEPTAALDARAEFDLYQHFTTLVKRRTSLLITHRFSTVRLANLIAILEDGRITEYGTHAELIRNGGAYAVLYGLQAEQYQPQQDQHVPWAAEAVANDKVPTRDVCTTVR